MTTIEILQKIIEKYGDLDIEGPDCWSCPIKTPNPHLYHVYAGVATESYSKPPSPVQQELLSKAKTLEEALEKAWEKINDSGESLGTD